MLGLVIVKSRKKTSDHAFWMPVTPLRAKVMPFIRSGGIEDRGPFSGKNGVLFFLERLALPRTGPVGSCNRCRIRVLGEQIGRMASVKRGSLKFGPERREIL